MNSKKLMILVLFVLLVSFVSGAISFNSIGNGSTADTTIINPNQFNTSQFNDDGGILNAVRSWWDGLYCKLTGCTMEGDIDMDGNDINNAGNIYNKTESDNRYARYELTTEGTNTTLKWLT